MRQTIQESPALCLEKTSFQWSKCHHSLGYSVGLRTFPRKLRLWPRQASDKDKARKKAPGFTWIYLDIGAKDGLLELDTTEAPPDITAIYPDKRDLIISPVKWTNVPARLLLQDKAYYEKARQNDTEGVTVKPTDFEAIEKENEKIRSEILCRNGHTTLWDWVSSRLNNARIRMEQRYRPGEPDEPLPVKTPRPTRPKWTTKRTLDMYQEPPPDNQLRPAKKPRNKPTKWTPLQKEQFESSINASMEAQLGAQELMTRAVTAAHTAGTNTEPPQPGETTGTQPPHPNTTWQRWEQLVRTLNIKSGTRAVTRLWSLRQAKTMQPLTTDQTEDLKEAEYTIARARDQLNRTQQRLQTDARLRAMPDRATQNMEWDEDRRLIYRKARQAKPRLHPDPQETNTHYTDLFRARLNTPADA
eukprot:g38480.t1